MQLICYCERSELLTTEKKEKTEYSYGGFLMFLEVSKIKRDICSGGFLVTLGSTKENSPYSYGGFLMFLDVSK